MDGMYRLVERATGRELALPEDPDQTAGAAAFSPNGTRLVVAADGLRVWDLCRLRTEWDPLGLGWEAPPYPSAPDQAAEPLAVTVDSGDLKP
jgi:hypothetical protein